MLVVGSGASGLAAAVAAERAGARVAIAAKGSLQSCNSAKAQGGIQAAFGEDDSPEIHAEDVWRSSHETAYKRLVGVLTSEAPSAIHWLEELGRRVHARERRLPPGALRRLEPQAAAPGRRPHGPRDHEGAARRRRGIVHGGLHEGAAAGAGPVNGHWRARVGEHELEATTVVLAAGGRCYREAEERGELSTNHPGATGEVTQLALELGAESRDLDALQYHPNGGAWPAGMQGYSIPETTRAYGAVLLNAGREEFTDSLGPRDEVSQAIVEEVRRAAASRRPTAARRCCSTRRASRRRTRRSRFRTCSAATVPRASTRYPSRS